MGLRKMKTIKNSGVEFAFLDSKGALTTLQLPSTVHYEVLLADHTTFKQTWFMSSYYKQLVLPLVVDTDDQ